MAILFSERERERERETETETETEREIGEKNIKLNTKVGFANAPHYTLN